MTRPPLLLDLFSGCGGAAYGYRMAGFDVVGVDIEDQPRYPFEFWQSGVVQVLRTGGIGPYSLKDFDAIHASPPCQAYSRAQPVQGNSHPRWIGPLRKRLEASGVPYVIENVIGAPLRPNRSITLCGSMFPALRVYRHRLFESNVFLTQPPHPTHIVPQAKMGRRPKPGQWINPIGNFHGADIARNAMMIPWATRNELSEAIPPPYTAYVGRQLVKSL